MSILANFVKGIFNVYLLPYGFYLLLFKLIYSFVGIAVNPIHNSIWNKPLWDFLNDGKEYILTFIIYLLEKCF